MIFVPGRQTH